MSGEAGEFALGQAWIPDSPAEARMLQVAAVRRLVLLRERHELTRVEVEAVARLTSRTPRTVWRWVAQAEAGGPLGPASRGRLVADEEIRVLLALHAGNVAAVHRDLEAAAADSGAKVPSLRNLQRAVSTDLTHGEVEALAHGERARRRYDVYLRRPRGNRNDVWEGDHVQADVEVHIDGTLFRPWITWFIDTCCNGVMGLAVTAVFPNTGSVLAALGASIRRDEGFGPLGGLPRMIRVDRGKDFLSNAVASSMALFGVPVQVLPGYTPHLKGHVEALNGAAAKMLFARLPRYTKAARMANNKPADPDAPALSFEQFVAAVLDFAHDWNTAPQKALGGRTPLQVWQDDPTPIDDVPVQDLLMFLQEDNGRHYQVTDRGVNVKGLYYVGPCLNGRVGDKVRARWPPHHTDKIEIFGLDGRHLGPAHLDDQASPEQRAALRKARNTAARQAAADHKAAAKRRRIRYAPATTATPPQPLDHTTATAAAAELSDYHSRALHAEALPDLFEPEPPDPDWVLPLPPPEGRPVAGTTVADQEQP